MKLIVHEIYTSVFQTYRPKKNTSVGILRPHLYVKNNPVGLLKTQICSADGTLIAESSTIDISLITTAIEYHGYVTFEVAASVKQNAEYIFKVVASGGYSFNESSYVGVCSDYDLRKYDSIGPIPHPLVSSLDFEIWSRSSK